GSHESLAGNLQALEQAKHGVFIGVHPSADGVDRTLDAPVILDHRAMLPEFVPKRMIEPVIDVELHCVQSLEPGLSPFFAPGNIRVRWLPLNGEKGRPPVEHILEDAAALVMRVIGVTV